MSTLIKGVKLIIVLCDVSLLVTLLLIKKVHVTLDLTFHEEVPYYVSPSSPIQWEKGSELESLGLENLGLELENNVFENTTLEKETTSRIEASDRSPIFEEETCGLYEEMTSRPLELDQSPISGDETGALDVETTSRIETSDQSTISENSDSDSCMDKVDAIAPSALPMPQSTRDSESNEDALSNPKWMDAMNAEMDALNKHKTWDLVPLSRRKKVVIGSKRLYSYLWSGLSGDLCPWLLTATGPYCNSMSKMCVDLKEEIYMDLPPGIPVTSKEGVVCKLRKLLYGLKQSLRAWFGRFTTSMKKFGDDQVEMQNLHKYLASEFEMKSLGDLKYFLGIEVARYKHGIFLSQRKYLKVTPSKRLMFCKYGHTDVEGYTDADWAGSITNRHSTSGYFTFVGGNLVTWRSKKQKVVSRSSAEAKYYGMAQGVCKLLWLRRLLRDLGFGAQKPMDLYCDNKTAIAIAHNPVQHDRTKHVEVD
ncbi:unnamed protein product [Prunus armeniaca]